MVAMLLSAGASVGAQSGPALQKGTVETGGLVGSTLPVTWLRAHSDRRLSMGSFHVGRVLTNQRGTGPLSGYFEMLLEVTPLLIVQQPARAVGLAASPLHLRWNFAPFAKGRIQPFGEASGGIVYTNHPVPVRTTSFNFIDQAGFGLRFPAGSRGAWLAGYRFQHISNAGRVKPNPGVNFNFAYVGVSFLR
jgi:Lipid A 3-O-deacylase (PagL)